VGLEVNKQVFLDEENIIAKATCQLWVELLFFSQSHLVLSLSIMLTLLTLGLKTNLPTCGAKIRYDGLLLDS